MLILKNKWIIIKLGIILYGVVSGRGSMSSISFQDMSIGLVDCGIIAILLFLFGIVALALLAKNQDVDERWERDQWNSNPFKIKQGFPIFHLFGLFFVAIGIGAITRIVQLENGNIIYACPFISFGLGLLASYYIAPHIFRKKYIGPRKVR